MSPTHAAALDPPYVPAVVEPAPGPLQSALDELYGYSDDLETRVLHRSRLNLFHHFVSGLIRRGDIRSFERALDLGCNGGYFSKMLTDFGFRDVLGIDIEPEFIDRARRAFGDATEGRRRTFRVGNAEELPAAEAFDFVLCTEVIEHTEHPGRVIANIATALRPGGIAVVTLPNRTSIPYSWARLTHAIRRKPYDPGLRDHLNWPSSRARHLFEPHGLERVATTGTNLFLFGPNIAALHGKPGFVTIQRINERLSRLSPIHRFAQFFFTAWRKPPAPAPSQTPSA